MVRLLRYPHGALRSLLESDSGSGIVLVVAAAAALIVANSPLAAGYEHLRHLPLGPLSALHWINDGLMAVFFLLIGLEIKRELIGGELSSWSSRTLPGISALGGMIVPAIIYLGIAGGPDHVRGWAIPTATDIAFALGIVTMLGPRVPLSLRVFLTALAILDDLGAILIIAIFYTTSLSFVWLALAIGGGLLLLMLNRLGFTALAPYLIVGVLLWFFVHRSGVHATIAGVLTALAIPVESAEDQSPLHRLEHMLQPWVGFAIVPLFAFANAGVTFTGSSSGASTDLPFAVGVGLFAGKQIGVFGFAGAAIRLRLSQPPADATMRQLYGVSLLCGIGFTMSLFIGLLAFAGQDALQDSVKIGVLAGSLLSAVAGALMLLPRPQAPLAEGDSTG